MSQKYVIAVNSLGDYRAGVVSALSARLESALAIYAGEPPFEPSVKTIDRAEFPYVVPVRNCYFLGRRLGFQIGSTLAAIAAQAAVVDLNPRMLSAWIVLLVRRLTGRRTAVWGHAWPRKGESAKTAWARVGMRRLAGIAVCYTEEQAKQLRKLEPSVLAFAAPNALYTSAQVRNLDAVPLDPSRNNIICVGRLVPEKKPLQLLLAFCAVADRLPVETQLIFVGAGVEEATLRQIALAQGMEHRVRIMGHVSDPVALKGIYASALVSVSPGYVGLSITQSFSFGIPMLISRNEPHSPEIEAAIEGFNVIFFGGEQDVDLEGTLEALFKNSAPWRERAEAIQEHCVSNYSAERMADGLISSLREQ